MLFIYQLKLNEIFFFPSLFDSVSVSVGGNQSQSTNLMHYQPPLDRNQAGRAGSIPKLVTVYLQ